MRRRTIIGGLGSLIALVSIACGPLIPTPVAPPVGSPLTPKAPLMAEFDRNLATWQAAGIRTYAFTYTPSCFCPVGSHLVVSDHGAVRIDGAAVDGTRALPIGAPVGVDGLFEIVRRAINGDRAAIMYDATTGVPISMVSDPIANAVDDELSFAVTGWTLDPPDDRTLGQVTTARLAWDARSFLTYTWSIRFTSDCVYDGQRFDITVKNGEATVRSRGTKIATDNLEGVPTTVPALFDDAAEMAVTGDLNVTLDREQGYPSRVEWHGNRPDAVRSVTIEVVSFKTPSIS